MLRRRGQEDDEVHEGVYKATEETMGLSIDLSCWSDAKVIHYLRSKSMNESVYDFDNLVYLNVMREFFKRGLDEREPELVI